MHNVHWTNPDFETTWDEYLGYYGSQPWWGEAYIGRLNGKLVSLDLPTERPGNNLESFKHIEGDTFRRIRDNGELGEEFTFLRDEEGKVIGAVKHNTIVFKK